MLTCGTPKKKSLVCFAVQISALTGDNGRTRCTLPTMDATSNGIACWLERRTRHRKVASSNPGRNGGRIVFSRVNCLCRLLFGVRSTPVLPQLCVKDPGHSARSAGDRLLLNTHTPLTRRSRNGLTMLLCRHSVETYQKTSSLATCQGTLGHSHLSSLSHCRLILA